MNDNLPPGVTGNEYQIAGPDFERDESRDCPSEGFTALTITGYGKNQIAQAVEDVLMAQRTLNALTVKQLDSQDDPYRFTTDGFVRAKDIDLSLLTVAVSRLRNALGDVTDVDIDMPCPFEGDVTVQGYNGVVSWECPLCRMVHEEEMD